jgi:LysR family glycine cleavage system transcriptional activator
MAQVSHLRSLQALDKAIRRGSIKGAAAELSITPAAVGQRIRALEDYLGTELLMRSRSGLKPTDELSAALADLSTAFDALDRVSEMLDFQRVTEIHVVCDPDLSELWLEPRIAPFRAENPNILFCINGEGDVPMRLGAPDVRIGLGGEGGETLFTDRLLPVSSADNLRRQGDFDDEHLLEGMPLLHVRGKGDRELRPGWREWFETFGHRREGRDRGTLYRTTRAAIENAKDDVGFLVCGLSLVADDLDAGRLTLVFPPSMSLQAPEPYRLHLRQAGLGRPQMQRFIDWLRAEAGATRARIAAFGETQR